MSLVFHIYLQQYPISMMQMGAGFTKKLFKYQSGTLVDMTWYDFMTV
jgi:hypothetical protein